MTLFYGTVSARKAALGMTGESPMVERIDAALQAAGLVRFGGFHPRPEDRVPALRDGRAVATLFMIGNAGGAMWRVFAAAPEAADGRPHPLDRWSARVLGRLADELSGAAILPSDGPPYPPFVAWAKRAAPVRESPLGMLIHPDYGLWHAYRGALALAERLALPPRDERPSPCASCAERPCLSTCPVAAFTPQGYDVELCFQHIEGAEGADCLELGCRARRACPVGRAYVYDPRQALFHMDAFAAARRAAKEEV